MASKTDFDRACIFVGGENLRHSIIDLFGSDFNPSDYLPKQADWGGFFDYLVNKANAELRLRSYWYAVDEIDLWPYNISKLLKNDPAKLEQVLRKYRPFSTQIDSAPDKK